MSESFTAISARIGSNSAALEKIRSQAENLAEISEKWGWVKVLSNTANGNLGGKEKIMLETYVQMRYFDLVIQRANRRLMVMSDGQYELKRRNEAENNRSQSGLELDVIDHYNGSQRSVRTLSGGESFKASLCLALGLSDEIQSSAGGSAWIPCSWTRVSVPWTMNLCSRPSRCFPACPKGTSWWASFPMWVN